jgi:DNA modification methylase
MQTGVLFCDDNLERLSELPAESVDLVYLDPPFFSNRFYEVIWGDEAEVRSFDDRWEGGIQHYIDWVKQRVVEMHRVLKPTGSFYFHCDPHASHYLKVMLDGVFGEAQLRNEVIWKRTSAHSSAHRYGPVHDTILYYAKGKTSTWNQQYVPHSEEYLRTKYRYFDEAGRCYRLDNLTAAGVRHGRSGEPWRGRDPTAKGYHWKFGVDRLDELDKEGRIYWPSKPDGIPQYKRYLDEVHGVALQDVWTDISPINSQAKERLGYPTQKPESLLSRIIESSSNRGDVVLDPFCGCGTTIAAASNLGRQWIGIDISPTAIEIMKRRLLKIGVDPIIENAPESIEALKALRPFEFQNWAINAMNGKHSPRKVGDMGIDGFSFLTLDPIQVKQSEHVGRPTVDSFETAIKRNGNDTGYIVAFSFTRGAVEEIARVKREGVNIKLVKVAELLLLAKRPGSRIAADLGPQPDNVLDLPIPPVRKPEDLPTAEELIASARQTASA